MIDTHYDLLSISYVDYLNNNFDKIKKFTDEIREAQVNCVFANLYFMSEEEMKYELHENYYNKNISVLDMFKTAKSVLEYYGHGIDFIYSIEGCDYIEKEDLSNLYNEGLRSLLLVWNNENKYGSGINTSKGLTLLGKDFLNEAINLNIGIDLSHANINTFNDIVSLIKESKKEVICYASHSNSRLLHDISRNLTDSQILSLKEINFFIGVISNIHFIKCNHLSSYEEKRKEYINHIKYISDLIGVDKVMLSTDDMRFASDKKEEYLYRPIYKYKTIRKDIEEDLLKVFGVEDTNKILYKNASSIVKKLKK